MLDYIRFNEDTPILNQLPYDFKSAAILLNPFIQMSLDWERTNRNNPYEHIYPTDEQIIKYGRSVLWEQVVFDCEFKNKKELVLALMTSIGAFKEEYARPDLVEKLNLNSDTYFPSEDYISIMMIDQIFKVLSSKGAKKISYSEPIFDKSGWIEMNELNYVRISEITSSEIILTDENMEFAFMSMYDSFITLFLSREENINNIVKEMNWEAIICDKNTFIQWYLQL